MTTALDTPVEPPALSDERVGQLRQHLIEEIERDSRKRERWARLRSGVTGRRRMLVGVAATLGAIYALPAIAEDRVFWWVRGPSDAFQPVSDVVTVGRWTSQPRMIRPQGGSVPTASFAARGGEWTLQAFAIRRGELCVGISPDPPRPANEGAAVACGFPVHGIRQPDSPELHWVGIATSIPGGQDDVSGPKFLYGPTAETVRRVDLESEDGRVVKVDTIAGPKELGVPARFWIVVLPVDHVVNTLVPRDEDGKALEHWRLEMAQ